MTPSAVSHFASLRVSEERWNKARAGEPIEFDSEDDEGTTPARRRRQEPSKREIVAKARDRLLSKICDTLRDAAEGEMLEAEELEELVDVAVTLERTVLERSHMENWMDTGTIPLFCGNVVKEEVKVNLSDSNAKEFLAIMAMASPQISKDQLKEVYDQIVVKPYDPARQPSVHTTPLALFSQTPPSPPPSPNPHLQAFFEARCEVRSRRTYHSIGLIQAGGILAAVGVGGDSLRNPCLVLYNLNHPEPGSNSDYEDVNVRLSDAARHFHLDPSRQLVYLADKERIKSYRWTVHDGGLVTSLPVHTLKSWDHSGAISVREGGAKLFRSGEKGIAIWDIDAMPTHGERGRTRIGEEMTWDFFDTPRDYTSGEIEASTGAPATTTVTSDALANIDVWKSHPSDPNQMLARYKQKYSIASVDLETQRVVSRFVGHGAFVDSFGTNAADPHCFVTGARDGGVRFFDSRLPVPVWAIEHGSEVIESVLYEQIGDRPFVIIGGTSSEQIKVWDARARASIYELSTGNNEVGALLWDAERQTLYASTESPHNRNGRNAGYRRAKFPRNNPHSGCGLVWPTHAYHQEMEFGYPLDSGYNRLFSYRFAQEADVTVLPEFSDGPE
ncbi:hypothetical protein OF83DRAFT_1158930 [Amylostereum chailletii]|nr:hypothetical protein OF83DRAFT_1158930 [Amylostereum chailletii]